MTQQEIFQNMTKGEWDVNEKVISRNDSPFPLVKGVSEYRKPKSNEANIRACASAVNNTYGKGINPESVEKMREILLLEQFYFEKHWFEYKGQTYGATTAESKLAQLRLEALTAAKLT